MLKFIQNNREITALLAVVLLFVLPGFLDRQYLSVQTLTMVYSSAQILILLAMGATLVMLTRNIDVSVGSITGMCAVLLGMLLNAGYSLPVACVATLPVSYTHLRAHETGRNLVCRLLLEKKKKKNK